MTQLIPKAQLGLGLKLLSRLGRVGNRAVKQRLISRTLNKVTPVVRSVEQNPEHQLFRSIVYRGGDITDPNFASFTTDPLYASHYGEVCPYLLESKGVAQAVDPLMGSRDPVTTDMFIYRNTKSNPNATVIMGQDEVTGEFSPSNGVEFFSLDPKNVTQIDWLSPKIMSWDQASKIYQDNYAYPVGYDSSGNMYVNKNYFYRRGYDLIDDAQASGVIRVPEGDYKPAVLKKYPFLNDDNPFSTMKMSHKFPYFSEGSLWPVKYGDTPATDLIAIPNDVKGTKWVAGSKWGSLRPDKLPSESGGRGTPLINGKTNQFPSSKALYYQYNTETKQYEPIFNSPIQYNIDAHQNYWVPVKNNREEILQQTNGSAHDLGEIFQKLFTRIGDLSKEGSDKAKK